MIEKVKDMELVKVDSQRIKSIIDIYFHWKTLDAEIKTISGTRGINFPSELSEYMVAYALSLHVNKKSASGDAVDLSNKDNPKIIEIKGCSAEDNTAPSSFSPSESFDELIFARLIKSEDKLYIYETGYNSINLGKIKVNNKQTLHDQQLEGRRPRFSIYNKIIKPNGIKPTVIFDIRNKEIIRM